MQNNSWWIARILIVLVISIGDVFGRPQDGNQTKSRILTHPPKFECSQIADQGELLRNETSSVPDLMTSTLIAKNEFGEEQDIVFPQDSVDKSDFDTRLGGNPKCADGLPFCEEVETYPYNHLKQVLLDNPMLKVLFGQDEAPQEIANRIGEEDEKFICRSIVKTIFPKIGQNKKNKWKFIVNQGEDDGFIQGVQIEICKSPEKECDIPGVIGSGYQTSCKQKYVYRRLLSVNNDGAPEPDTFKIPSACCCAYRQTFDFLSRFGRNITPS